MSRQHFFKDQQFHFALWPCDLSINRGHLLSRGIRCTKFGNFSAKGSRDTEWTTFEQRQEVWSWHLTIWLLRGIHCTKFDSIHEKDSKDIKWILLYKDQHFDIDLWPCYLKINRGPLFSWGIKCTMYMASNQSLAIFKQRGQKILSRNRFAFQTDRPTDWCRQYAPSSPFFFKKPQNILYS